MKKNIRRIQLRWVLPCLALTAILTLPAAVTQSKYVWQDNIKINLVIATGGQSLTSLLPDGYPSEFWAQELTNIQATATAEGLILTAVDGYTLPESITVRINETEYTVFTDGQNNPEGITFDPESGTLMISDAVLADNPGPVAVIAQGVSKQDQITQDQVAQDQVTQDQITQDQVAQDQVTQDQVTQDQVTQDQVAQDQAPQEP